MTCTENKRNSNLGQDPIKDKYSMYVISSQFRVEFQILHKNGDDMTYIEMH